MRTIKGVGSRIAKIEQVGTRYRVTCWVNHGETMVRFFGNSGSRTFKTEDKAIRVAIRFAYGTVCMEVT